MYVVCFYWQGDRWQENGYKQEKGYVNPLQHHLDKAGQIDSHLPSRYVNNLYYGVKRFADREFKFVCFTNAELDLDRNIEIRPLPLFSRSGVLPRIYMFSEESGLFGHQVLCLDIDIVVVGSLSKLMGYEGLFCSRTNNFGKGPDRKPDGDIMSFSAGKEAEEVFWKPFVRDIPAAEELTQGRERFWLWECIKDKHWDLWEDVAPKQVLSYKIQHIAESGKVPKGAAIISCHGVPRPHKIAELAEKSSRYAWIQKYWV